MQSKVLSQILKPEEIALIDGAVIKAEGVISRAEVDGNNPLILSTKEFIQYMKEPIDSGDKQERVLVFRRILVKLTAKMNSMRIACQSTIEKDVVAYFEMAIFNSFADSKTGDGANSFSEQLDLGFKLIKEVRTLNNIRMVVPIHFVRYPDLLVAYNLSKDRESSQGGQGGSIIVEAVRKVLATTMTGKEVEPPVGQDDYDDMIVSRVRATKTAPAATSTEKEEVADNRKKEDSGQMKINVDAPLNETVSSKYAESNTDDFADSLSNIGENEKMNAIEEHKMKVATKINETSGPLDWINEELEQLDKEEINYDNDTNSMTLGSMLENVNTDLAAVFSDQTNDSEYEEYVSKRQFWPYVPNLVGDVLEDEYKNDIIRILQKYFEEKDPKVFDGLTDDVIANELQESLSSTLMLCESIVEMISVDYKLSNKPRLSKMKNVFMPMVIDENIEEMPNLMFDIREPNISERFKETAVFKIVMNEVYALSKKSLSVLACAKLEECVFRLQRFMNAEMMKISVPSPDIDSDKLPGYLNRVAQFNKIDNRRMTNPRSKTYKDAIVNYVKYIKFMKWIGRSTISKTEEGVIVLSPIDKIYENTKKRDKIIQIAEKLSNCTAVPYIVARIQSMIDEHNRKYQLSRISNYKEVTEYYNIPSLKKRFFRYAESLDECLVKEVLVSKYSEIFDVYHDATNSMMIDDRKRIGNKRRRRALNNNKLLNILTIKSIDVDNTIAEGVHKQKYLKKIDNINKRAQQHKDEKNVKNMVKDSDVEDKDSKKKKDYKPLFKVKINTDGIQPDGTPLYGTIDDERIRNDEDKFKPRKADVLQKSGKSDQTVRPDITAEEFIKNTKYSITENNSSISQTSRFVRLHTERDNYSKELKALKKDNVPPGFEDNDDDIDTIKLAGKRKGIGRYKVGDHSVNGGNGIDLIKRQVALGLGSGCLNRIKQMLQYKEEHVVRERTRFTVQSTINGPTSLGNSRYYRATGAIDRFISNKLQIPRIEVVSTNRIERETLEPKDLGSGIYDNNNKLGVKSAQSELQGVCVGKKMSETLVPLLEQGNALYDNRQLGFRFWLVWSMIDDMDRNGLNYTVDANNPLPRGTFERFNIRDDNTQPNHYATMENWIKQGRFGTYWYNESNNVLNGLYMLALGPTRFVIPNRDESHIASYFDMEDIRFGILTQGNEELPAFGLMNSSSFLAFGLKWFGEMGMLNDFMEGFFAMSTFMNGKVKRFEQRKDVWKYRFYDTYLQTGGFNMPTPWGSNPLHVLLKNIRKATLSEQYEEDFKLFSSRDALIIPFVSVALSAQISCAFSLALQSDNITGRVLGAQVSAHDFSNPARTYWYNARVITPETPVASIFQSTHSMLSQYTDLVVPVDFLRGHRWSFEYNHLDNVDELSDYWGGVWWEYVPYLNDPFCCAQLFKGWPLLLGIYEPPVSYDLTLEIENNAAGYARGWHSVRGDGSYITSASSVTPYIAKTYALHAINAYLQHQVNMPDIVIDFDGFQLNRHNNAASDNIEGRYVPAINGRGRFILPGTLISYDWFQSLVIAPVIRDNGWGIDGMQQTLRHNKVSSYNAGYTLPDHEMAMEIDVSAFASFKIAESKGKGSSSGIDNAEVKDKSSSGIVEDGSVPKTSEN